VRRAPAQPRRGGGGLARVGVGWVVLGLLGGFYLLSSVFQPHLGLRLRISRTDWVSLYGRVRCECAYVVFFSSFPKYGLSIP